MPDQDAKGGSIKRVGESVQAIEQDGLDGGDTQSANLAKFLAKRRGRETLDLVKVAMMAFDQPARHTEHKNRVGGAKLQTRDPK